MTLHPEGYLEVVVAEHQAVSWDDCVSALGRLQEQGYTEIRVLISREHRYGLVPDYVTYDLSHGLPVTVRKVAYFAPMPTAQTLAHVVGETALHNVPHAVFAERDRALAWLLAD